MENEQSQVKRKITWRDFFNLHSLSFLMCGIVVGALSILIPYSIHDWNFVGFIDGTFLAAALNIGLGLLVLASNQGTFDVISLGFSDLFNTIKKNGERKYDGLFDYREQRKQIRHSKRFSYLALELDGLIFLIISIISYFIYY